MSPRTHGRIRFTFVNSPKQGPIEPTLNGERGEVRRWRNKFDSESTFPVDAVATDAGVDIDFPPTDRIASFCLGRKVVDSNSAEPHHRDPR